MKIVEQIFLITFGAILTASLGYYLGDRPESLSKVQYISFTRDAIVNLPNKINALSITYNGKRLETMSSVDYYISNVSKNNIQDLKLYFSMDDVAYSKLLYHDVEPANNQAKNSITTFSVNDSDSIGYKIDYINRSESVFDGIRFVFVFAGSEPPKIEVRSGTKGVDLSKYEARNNAVSALKNFWWVFVIYIVFSWGLLKYSQYRKEVVYLRISKSIDKVCANETKDFRKLLLEEIRGSAEKSVKFKKVIKYIRNQKL